MGPVEAASIGIVVGVVVLNILIPLAVTKLMEKWL